MTLLLLSAASVARAGVPVLHEYFEPKPDEDLAFDARTADGALPAALQTESGLVSAPKESTDPNSVLPAYDATSTPQSADATYRIDRTTTRPDVVSYEDPFLPSIAPFKRMYAYDTVGPSLELTVSNPRLEEIGVGGEVEPGDDQFYADYTVALSKDAAVRVPSVGPGARVIALKTEPQTEVSLARDGADNWFVRAKENRRVRVLMQIAIPRRVFGGEFGATSWASLQSKLKKLPDSIRPETREVIQEIGIASTSSPQEAVSRLIHYYRGFAPSSELPQASSGAGLYKELSLSRKGVCRHRAYAFVITATELGIPSRFVRNEAHAWVEVFDGELWHRIDLGGAAGRMEFEDEPSRNPHLPPQDPYPWPDGAETGLEMATRASSTGASSASPDGNGVDTDNSQSHRTQTPGQNPAAPDFSSPNVPPTPPSEPAPPSHVKLRLVTQDAKRGEPVRVQGGVTADGEPCAFARVDLWLEDEAGQRTLLGALPTDGEGRFSGAMTIGMQIGVGHYRVVATTPGNQNCGPTLGADY